MGARGDLRHHPAIDGVQIELRAHHARQDRAAPVSLEPHEGRCGLVAARLDAEHGQGGVCAAGRHGAFYRDCGGRLKGEAKPAINAPGIGPFGHKAQGVRPLCPPGPSSSARRGSPLALWQARHVRSLLMAAHGLSEGDIELSKITTSGDRIADKPLRDFGGKGLFTKEIDEALLSGAVDLAVHSMKDLPTVLPEGLIVAAVLPRADVRDAFISTKAPSLAELAPGSVVGTSSLAARGAGEAAPPRPRNHRLFAAMWTRGCASSTRAQPMRRCSLSPALSGSGSPRTSPRSCSTEEMLPAVAQGAIGVAARSDDDKTRALPRDAERCALGHGRCLRARLPRPPRRLVQDADRRSRRDRGRRVALSRAHPHP